MERWSESKNLIREGKAKICASVGVFPAVALFVWILDRIWVLLAVGGAVAIFSWGAHQAIQGVQIERKRRSASTVRSSRNAGATEAA